jgi:thiamine-triphosphatase
MIEVEKKFHLTEEQKERLIKDSEFFSKVIFTDEYYDTDTYTLTTKDVWLRARDGQWELKIPMAVGDRKTDQYEEITEEALIRKYLDLQDNGKDMEQTLADAGYAPFCICGTTRTKYRKGDFMIDIDSVEYGDMSYALAEIELLVEDRAEIADASQKILSFAEAEGLEIAPVRGKVIEYLRLKRPEHFEALIKAGVAKAKGV